MAKSKTKFVCQSCGFENPKFMGRCPGCGQWNTLVEELEETDKNIVNHSDNIPVCINNLKSGQYERYDTGITELNRVLGGGLVRGSLTLISGDPGIGKSTLLLKCAENISLRYGKVIYVSGEESGEQIKIRGDRLLCNSPQLYILSETNLKTIEKIISEEQPAFVIIDSIQTMFSSSLSSAPGSVSQVRECANNLMKIGKSSNIPLFIVAHVTKLGDLAGPRVLEHMVDTVLSFEGERSEEYRILRTVKNRFGTTSEIGVFEMREQGLMEVLNPSDAFINSSEDNTEGSVIIGIVEGTRPILVEIQALVTESKAAFPRRTCVGVELNRLNLILAVLEKKLKLPFYKYDVYINVAGGLNIEGTYGDLGLAAALISSIKSKEVKLRKLIIAGELGLTGEVRKVSHCERVVNEGEKLGFQNIIIPKKSIDRVNNKKINIIAIEDIREAVRYLF